MGKHKHKHKNKSEKHKKSKKHKRRHSSSDSSDSSTEDEWVEKVIPTSKKPENTVDDSKDRDEWMSLPSNFLTTSNADRRKEKELLKRQEKEREQYDPRKNVRELNPYWKDGGEGLPQFKKPSDEAASNSHRSSASSSSRSSNWRKKQPNSSTETSKTVKISEKRDDIIVTNVKEASNAEPVSDKELNVLAAKLVKAEILGNTKLMAELKEKLEKAREMRNNAPSSTAQDDEVVLTRTDSKGYSRPLKTQSEYGEGSRNSRKKQKVETHAHGERIRYFPDDDKYTLKQMFENEKFNSAEDQNAEFLKLAGKIAKNDDLDDVFSDKIRRKESDEKMDRRNRERAIGEHQKTNQSLENCNLCLQSEKMQKHLMISMGETFYLSLPSQEPLTDGHCLLVPLRHVPCATQLDENEWEELMNFRKALTKMFASSDDDIVFFETAMYLNRFPHMSLQCVPLPREQGDLAPIYFKKAIDESETEWSSNKKLVSLKGRDVRRAIPKGLDYFSVSFGMDEGYAHVIEDQRLFPGNFAQEVIGGMLDLHHSKWRNPKRQSFEEQSKRVLEFNKNWCNFDPTVQ